MRVGIFTSQPTTSTRSPRATPPTVTPLPADPSQKQALLVSVRVCLFPSFSSPRSLKTFIQTSDLSVRPFVPDGQNSSRCCSLDAQYKPLCVYYDDGNAHTCIQFPLVCVRAWRQELVSQLSLPRVPGSEPQPNLTTPRLFPTACETHQHSISGMYVLSLD